MDNDRRSKFVTSDDEPLDIDRSQARGPNLLAGRTARLTENMEAEVEALAETMARETSLSLDQSRMAIRSIANFADRNPSIVDAIVGFKLPRARRKKSGDDRTLHNDAG